MSEPAKISPIRPDTVQADAGRMLVTMSIGELRAIIRQEVGAPALAVELVDAETLSKKLSVPVSWVYEQSRLNQIPTHRVGRYIRFDIREVLESQKNKTLTR